MIDKDSIKFIKENSGQPSKWLAAKTGYSEMTIRNYLKALGIQSLHRRITEDMKEYILEHKELSGKEIASTLGISPSAVSGVRAIDRIKKHESNL